MELSEATRQGRLAGLEAMRERLSRDLEGCESLRDTVAISRLLAELLSQIEELKAPLTEKPLTALDELRRRRESRDKKTG